MHGSGIRINFADAMKTNREILRLSVPAIVSNITVPLLGLSDTAIAGHLDADFFIGAIAVGSMMFNVTFWLFGFLRMGTTGLTALAFGRGDRNALKATFCRAVILGGTIGILLLLAGMPLRELLLGTISPEGDVRRLASDYYSVCIWAAPAILATTAIQGWLFGMQTTVIPMIVSVSVNVINIAASLALVFLFKTGFIGIAYGTLLANWCGLLLAIVMARRKAGCGLWCGWRNVFAKGELKRFFTVNTDIFFRSACIMSVSLATTAIGARLGELTLATNAVMMQFFHFFSFFMDGFAFTAEALTGRFAGALDFQSLRRSRNALLLWSAGIAMTFFVIYRFFYAPITGLITDSPTVRENISCYSLWLTLIPPLTVAAFIYDGFFIGLTATRRMLIVTIAAALVFFAVCFLHSDGIRLPDNNRLWAAFLAYLLTRGSLLALQSKSVFSREHILKLRPS